VPPWLVAHGVPIMPMPGGVFAGSAAGGSCKLLLAPTNLAKRWASACQACGDIRHRSVNYYHCPLNPRHKAEGLKGPRFPLLRLSSEMQAFVLTLAAEQAGVVHKAVQASKELRTVVCDDRLCPKLWQLMHGRMPSSNKGEYMFFKNMAARAATFAGGWRSLCREKAFYAWRCSLGLGLPCGPCYALSPAEEMGLFEQLFSLGRAYPAISLVGLVDGSASMHPCFQAMMGCIRRMLLHLQKKTSRGSVGGHTVSLMQFNHEVVRVDSPSAVSPLLSAEVQQQLASWDSIGLLGGGTNFMHALNEAGTTFKALPADNYKLLLLFTDGIAEDWCEVLRNMLAMQEATPGMSFKVLGITENRRRCYEGYNFPVPATLKTLGPAHGDQLVILSHETPESHSVLPRPCQLSIIAPG